MKIYIDESGSFAEKKDIGDSWNVVAAYVIPDRSNEKLSDQMIKHRELTNKPEPKISDFSSNSALINMIRNFSNLNGTLFAAIINTSTEESGFHNNVCDIDSQSNGKDSDQISGKKQLQLQANLFLELLNSTFWGAWIRYGEATPLELKSNHEWLVDEKCRRYEDFVRKVISHYMRGEYLNYEYKFNQQERNVAINENRLIPPHVIKLANSSRKSINDQRRTSIDITPKNAFDNLQFYDSKKIDGIQVAGLLAGAIRGCLMEKYGKSNKAISRSLGRLMMKKPKGLSVIPRNGNGIPNKENRFIPVFDKFTEDGFYNRSLETMRSSAINIY